MPLKLVIMVLVFLIIPIYLGAGIAKPMRIYQERRITDTIFFYVSGLVLMWAIFQIITVPMILLRLPFRYAVNAWCAVTLVCLLVLLTVFRVFWPFPKLRKPELSWKVILVLMMFALIGFQVYQYVFKMHIDDDDARFVVTAVEAYEKNTMMLIHPVTGINVGTWIGERVKDVPSPWMIFVALIGKICMIHPTIIAHTVLPALLLLTTYAVYWLLGDRLMKRDFVRTSFFVIFTAVVIRYYGGGPRTQGSFILVRIWQGKAAFAAIIIPLILLLFLVQQEVQEDQNLWLMFLITDCAACLMSGMGIFMSGFMTGLYLLYYILADRRWKRIWMLPVCCAPTVVYGLIYIFLK